MKKFGSLVICMALLLCACKKPDADITISESSVSEETTEETEEEDLYPCLTYEELSEIEGTMFEANLYNTEDNNEYVDYLDTISFVVNYDGTLVIHLAYNLSPDFVEFFDLSEEELMTIYKLGHDGYYDNIFEDLDNPDMDDSLWDFAFYDEDNQMRHQFYEGAMSPSSRLGDFLNIANPYIDQIMFDVLDGVNLESEEYDEDITIQWVVVDSETLDETTHTFSFNATSGMSIFVVLYGEDGEEKEATVDVISYDGVQAVITFSLLMTDSENHVADTFVVSVGEEATFTYEDSVVTASCSILIE